MIMIMMMTRMITFLQVIGDVFVLMIMIMIMMMTRMIIFSAGDWRCLCSAGWDGDDCSTRLETNCADGVDNDGGAFLVVLLVVLVLVVLLRCCFLNSC